MLSFYWQSVPLSLITTETLTACFKYEKKIRNHKAFFSYAKTDNVPVHKMAFFSDILMKNVSTEVSTGSAKTPIKSYFTKQNKEISF